MKETTKPKEQFKDRLIQWAERTLGTSFSNLNSFQQSRQMTMFFIREILEKLSPGLVPDDDGEIESSIVDGSGDGGVDFIYRTEEGIVVLIQAKYRGKDANESPEAVGRFCDLLDRLKLSCEGEQQSLNKGLIDIASQIDWSEDAFRMFYITTAKTTPAVKDRVDQGISAVHDFDEFEERVEFYYLDATLLNEQLREAISSADFSARDIIIPMMPDANGNAWCHFESDERELYLGEVQGSVLANILQEHRASLFTMNIRDYVGDSKTNKQIVETALNTPHNFEYYNNGVTAVAGRISADKDKRTLTCQKMSIINGAQTVRSLLNATKRKSKTAYKPVSDVRVVLRLMSFSYPSEVAFVGDVTRFNNTQNAVKIADFRSNDGVQKDLARRFASINLNGRRYEYKNKRSSKTRNSIPITLEELTKSLFAFKFGPDDMFGGTAKLFDTSTSGLYLKLYERPEDQLLDVQFNLIAGTFFACDYVKSLWEEFRKALRIQKQSMHPALERKGLLYFTVGELERLSYSKQHLDLNGALAKLAKPNNWLNGENSGPQIALSKAFDLARRVLIQSYELKQKSDPSFKHRNWFRDPDTLKDIRSGLGMALEFGEPPTLWPK